MRSFSIIEVRDPLWVDIISSANQYDFYHTRSYSLLVQNHRPILCVASYDNNFIAIPLVIRKIEGTDLYDCTSVYGYCGPISNIPMKCLSRAHVEYFQTELLSFFHEKNIVSVFSRLHPLICSDRVLEGVGEIKFVNKTVGIDLTLPIEVQLEKYRQNHRRNILKMRENGFVVTEVSNKNEINSFSDLYTATMNRLNADFSYYFNYEYFYSLINNPCFKVKLLIAKKEDEIAGGAIFTFTQNIMQYHLGADSFKFRQLSPMKMIFDDARLIGYNLKMKLLHLGGGYSGNTNDSLFHFKRGFSDLLFDFEVWELIVDHEKYFDLSEFTTRDKENSGKYFPAYRAK